MSTDGKPTSTMPAISMAAVPGRRKKTIELAKRIESIGFSGIYGPSLGDAMGLCLSLAHETETINFGTSIVNIYTRNSIDYAQTAAFIHEVSEGRFRWGLGVSHAPMNSRLGVTTGKPLSDMRSFVADVRAVERIGDLPPIVLAGLRDKMCALASEIGDGVTFANVARSFVPTTIERMKAANPTDDSFEIWNMIPTCISDDRDAAAAVNRKTLTMYVGLPNYRNYWKQAGYADEMNAIEDMINNGDRKQVTTLMTDEWLSDCTLYGSADEVRAGLDAWMQTEVTPILVPSSASGGQMQAFDELFALFD